MPIHLVVNVVQKKTLDDQHVFVLTVKQYTISFLLKIAQFDNNSSLAKFYHSLFIINL